MRLTRLVLALGFALVPLRVEGQQAAADDIRAFRQGI